MSLIRWNPQKDLLNFEREFNRLFDSLGVLRRSDDADEYENAVWSPLTDIVEEKDRYVFKTDLPGVDPKEVKINLVDGRLSISGERKMETEEKEKNYHRVERSYGKYYRSFTLPRTVQADKIDAEFKNGQLMITVPKAEEAKPKEISVKIS